MGDIMNFKVAVQFNHKDRYKSVFAESEMIAHRKLCLQLGFIKARESLPGVSRLEMGRRQQVFHS